MSLPQDPYILLSYLNTQLRDKYATLLLLCDDLDINAAELEEKMQKIGYHYDAGRNQFVR